MITATSYDLSPEMWLELLPYLTKEERVFIEKVLAERKAIWEPLPGPQTEALNSKADVIGYGGAAGGGKTDLLCGKMLTRHISGLVVRREATQLSGILDRFTEIIGSRDGFNGQEKIWRLKANSKARAKQIVFGSTPHVDDWNKYQGRARDFLGIDEAANFLEIQVRMLIGWVRTVLRDQSAQTLMTFNPPTTVEGRWIIDFFAPWLDDKHPCPAAPGELRYFANIDGKEQEVEDTRPFVNTPAGKLYDFQPKDHKPTEIIKPQSRTFIPSRITDNPYLLGTGYMAQLQALPEPLRSQMLNGDFKAGMKDDVWQVIPTAWVDAAMERWVKRAVKGEMLSLGVDVARDGEDNTVIAPRHHDPLTGSNHYYDELTLIPGKQTPDGPTTAGHVITASRDNAPQHIDIIGVGASPYDFLVKANQPVQAVDVRNKTTETDRSGLLTFSNVRSYLFWRFRELLDPQNNYGVMLPPDKDLARELCTPKWESSGQVIKVQSREKIYEDLKRSIDRAWAVIFASIDTPKIRHIEHGDMGANGEYNPYADEGARNNDNSTYNPYEGM